MRRSGPRYFGDKRNYFRRNITGKIAFHTDGSELVVLGELVDVSTAGVGMRVSLEQAKHMRCLSDVGILYLDAAVLAGPVRCYANVARQICGRNGQVLVGMEIISIEDEDLDKLLDYLAHADACQAQDNALLKRAA